MTETANSFEDIMRMRLGTFLGIVKHIRLNYLMQNPEWREAYLKHSQLEAYRSGKVTKQAPDIQGLVSMQSD